MFGAGRASKPARAFEPEIIRIESSRFEIDHQIVFGDQVQPPAAPCDAHELGDGAIGVGNRLKHVAAHDEIELRARKTEIENTAVLESHALAERSASRPGHVEMAVDDVDAKHAGLGKQLRQSLRNLSCAAACIQHVRVGRKAVPLEECFLLRPDRVGLRGEIAHHRLVGHFPGLRIEIVHPAGPRSALGDLHAWVDRQRRPTRLIRIGRRGGRFE